MLPTRENCYRHVAHHTTLGKSPTSRNFQPAFIIYYSIVYNSIEKEIEIKEAFTEELLKQIDLWNQKLRELNIPLKVDLNYTDETV